MLHDVSKHMLRDCGGYIVYCSVLAGKCWPAVSLRAGYGLTHCTRKLRHLGRHRTRINLPSCISLALE